MLRRRIWDVLFSTGVWMMVIAFVVVLFQNPHDEQPSETNHGNCSTCRTWPKQPVTPEVAVQLARDAEARFAEIRLARQPDRR